MSLKNRLSPEMVHPTLADDIHFEDPRETKQLIDNVMGKGKNAKKNIKKEPAKTTKEKKAEKRLKKSK